MSSASLTRVTGHPIMRLYEFVLRAALPMLVGACLASTSRCCPAQWSKLGDTPGDELAAEYFRLQTDQITNRTFSEIETLDDWTSRREEYRRQLLEMLGLDPIPERTPLKPVITGTVESDEFVVEKLQFQSLPGLYVTGNLYRPKQQSKPLPAILYVCGHGGVRKDGVSLGNKTHYQHHGAWFARHGYVCLTIDTIQLGEIEGIHHGTYREQMWWWNNRGYTPAGVEAWNCSRSLDYLESRPEVDAERMGVTGRSGGGAYSWWIAAIDDRIKVTVPVAGIASLKNHVIDGTVEGHCDCMFMVNTYRWDYPMVAALVAPRPLLISNTDKDRIFPLDGVVDVYQKVREIYSLYDATANLGLQITEGPHKDTQELRIHAFRWFNRFLKDDDGLIESAATPYFEKERLKVFDDLPGDERVTTIHESFVPAFSEDQIEPSQDEVAKLAQQKTKELTEHCFRGWPNQPCELEIEITARKKNGVTVQTIDYTSQQPYRLRMYWIGEASPKPVDVYVLNQQGWEQHFAALAVADPDASPDGEPDPALFAQLVKKSEQAHQVFVVPRGIGPTEWSRDPKKRVQIRRRFMQLGQTVATMQIYDVRRALQAIGEIDSLNGETLTLHARGNAAAWTLYAALFEDHIDQLRLANVPRRNRDAPDLLNVSRFIEIPWLMRLVRTRAGDLTVDSWAE